MPQNHRFNPPSVASVRFEVCIDVRNQLFSFLLKVWRTVESRTHFRSFQRFLIPLSSSQLVRQMQRQSFPYQNVRIRANDRLKEIAVIQKAKKKETLDFCQKI
jgi:hypothetical protein